MRGADGYLPSHKGEELCPDDHSVQALLDPEDLLPLSSLPPSSLTNIYLVDLVDFLINKKKLIR